MVLGTKVLEEIILHRICEDFGNSTAPKGEGEWQGINKKVKGGLLCYLILFDAFPSKL